MKKRLFAILLVSAVVLSLTACGGNKDEDTNTDNDTSSSAQTDSGSGEENTDQSDSASDAMPEDIDKYWNIDTKEFDASRFDGKFSIAGEVVQSKLTGKTLQENGFELVSNSVAFKDLVWNEEQNAYTDKNGICIMKNGSELLDPMEHLVNMTNYKNETDIYSDNTEISYYQNNVTETYNDVIIPTCLITEPDELVYGTLTIERIVEQLGAPTYVRGRKSRSIDEGEYFTYVYVYDDYTLWFNFMYYENTGIMNVGYEYEGNQSFNQPCEYYIGATGEFKEYSNHSDYLNEEQAKYEASK